MAQGMTYNVSTSSSNDTGTDDLFANSSTETVVENIDFSLILEEGNQLLRNNCLLSTMDIGAKSVHQHSNALNNQCLTPESKHSSMENSVMTQVPCEATNISLVTNEFVAEASNFPQKLYCPLCIQEYTFEFMLKEHIKDVHKSELNRIITQEGNEIVLLHACLFCHAKFYSKGLLPKHVINNHRNDVIRMLQNRSPDKYISCMFCPHKVFRKHTKLLIIHIEKKHSVEFEYFLESHTSGFSVSSADHSSVQVPCTPGLSDLFTQMDTSDNVNNILDVDIITTPKVVPRSILKNKNNDQENVIPNVYVRRGLKFDDFHPVKEGFRNELPLDTSDVIEMKKTRKSKWKSILSFKKKKNTTDKDPQFNKGKTSKFVTSTPKDTKIEKLNRNKFSNRSPLIAQYCNTKTTDQTCSFQLSYVHHQGYSPKKKVTFKSHASKLEVASAGKIDVETNEYSRSVTSVKQFKCGLCLQAFTDNTDLLCHKKKHHRGPLNMLNPLYRCGECEAKFYRNSFLIRHCKHHHTPLCLRNKKS